MSKSCDNTHYSQTAWNSVWIKMQSVLSTEAPSPTTSRLNCLRRVTFLQIWERVTHNESNLLFFSEKKRSSVFCHPQYPKYLRSWQSVSPRKLRRGTKPLLVIRVVIVIDITGLPPWLAVYGTFRSLLEVGSVSKVGVVKRVRPAAHKPHT